MQPNKKFWMKLHVFLHTNEFKDHEWLEIMNQFFICYQKCTLLFIGIAIFNHCYCIPKSNGTYDHIRNSRNNLVGNLLRTIWCSFIIAFNKYGIFLVHVSIFSWNVDKYSYPSFCALSVSAHQQMLTVPRFVRIINSISAHFA